MTTTPGPSPISEPVLLDGARGEGGGQILRTALSLALLTGRPFRIDRIRANRDKPGLRPQHLAAVEAAAGLGHAEVEGAQVGSRTLTFRPRPFEPTDRAVDIGTAGSTALVLQTLALPIALRASRPVRLSLVGGTFNLAAPSFPYLERTWRPLMAAAGLDVALAMPAAGFYPQGGGRLEAWIEPGRPRAAVIERRGRLTAIAGVALACRLGDRRVAERMRDRAVRLLGEHGLGVDPEVEVVDATGPAPGAAIALSALCDGEGPPATFVGLGARGKPAEAVAEEAVDQLLAHLDAPGGGALDLHAADQVLLPLALAEGRSTFTVAEVTDHLRTNVETIAAFLDRPIRIDEPAGGPGRVIVG